MGRLRLPLEPNRPERHLIGTTAVFCNVKWSGTTTNHLTAQPLGPVRQKARCRGPLCYTMLDGAFLPTAHIASLGKC